MNLEKLIILSAEGKASAQKALFLQTSNHLKTVALRYVKYATAADDVLQEAYIRIYKNLPKFNYENDVTAMGWMRQITSREAIRYIKRHQRWSEHDNKVPIINHHETQPMMMDDMYLMLTKLPDNQRIVFNLAAIEGYSHKEVAEQLDIKESSSRSLLTRARQNLQEQLSKRQAYESA
jgi:RNA polymerase sigma-70 factor (ECF subfamily)